MEGGLCYKPEVCVIDSRCRWIFFNWSYPSSCNMALGSPQPLKEISTRNLPGGKERPARKADKPHRHLWADCLENLEASRSHKPMSLHGWLYLLLFSCGSIRWWITWCNLKFKDDLLSNMWHRRNISWSWQPFLHVACLFYQSILM
jgi:hypothetical protein